jgi:hypothetical protein
MFVRLRIVDIKVRELKQTVIAGTRTNIYLIAHLSTAYNVRHQTNPRGDLGVPIGSDVPLYHLMIVMAMALQ